MATFVLVGGAWMGAWVWRDVARELRRRGHVVYPTTLSGLGDRAHLANPSIDLETHITDVVKLMEFEDLREVTLVGHSYAGSVVTGVADREANRLELLLYCDSAPLADGQTMLGLNSEDGQALVRRQVKEQGEGWLLPPMEWDPEQNAASLRGLGERELELLRRKATPQPFGTWTQPLQLRSTGPRTYRRAIVLCDDGKRVMARARASLAAGEPYFRALAGDDWEFRELDTGHWPMLTMPIELAATFEELASRPRPHSSSGG